MSIESGPSESTPLDRPPRGDRRRWWIAGAFLATAAASCMYRILVAHHLEQTSALFIGIPTVLGILLAQTRPAGTLQGMVFKGVTFALLFAGAFLGEGFICLVMAAPIFFMIASLVVLVISWTRRKVRRAPDAAALGLIVLVLGPMSFEGTSARLSWPRQEQVASRRILTASAAEIASRLARPPRLEPPLPAFLRLGFPRPDGATGSGLRAGDRRVIHFSGGEGKPGDLVLEVVAAGPGLVRFRAVADSTHVAHWLRWEESEVRWREIGPRRVEVRWSLRYRRDLDPAWYFGPWERFAVRLAASYLIDTLAAPPPPAAPPPGFLARNDTAAKLAAPAPAAAAATRMAGGARR
jgi:hypothetical protein